MFYELLELSFFAASFASFLSDEIALNRDYDRNLKYYIKHVMASFISEGDTLIIFCGKDVFFPNFEFKHTHVTLEDVHQISYNTTNEIFLIGEKNFESFRENFEAYKDSSLWNPSFGPRAKYIVVIFQTFEAERLFSYLWGYDITNVALMICDGRNGAIKLFVADPYDDKSACGQYVFPQTVTLYDINKIREKFELPNALTGCEFKAMILTQLVEYPYVSDPYSETPGVLVYPLKLMAEKLNFTLLFQNVEEKYQKAYIIDGVLAVYDLVYVNKSVDIYVASTMRTLESYQFYDMSDIFQYATYDWTIKKPNMIPHSEVLLTTFTLRAWLGVTVILTLVALIGSYIGKYTKETHYKRFGQSFMNILAIQFGSSVQYVPQYRVLKILFIFYTVYAFHINFYFQGRLSSMLTKPIEETSVNNVAELLNSNIIPIIRPVVRNTLKDTLAHDMYLKSRATSLKGLDRLKFVAKHNNVSSPTAYLYLDVYPDLKAQIKLIGTDYMLQMEGTYGIRKGHPFIPVLNKFIGKYFEGGLSFFLLTKMKQISFSKIESEEVVLSLEHLKIAFFFLLSGYLLGTLAFVGEVGFAYTLKK